MKRFFMYVVVIIGVLAVGLTTYYFAKNNETIGLTITEGSTVYLNKTEDDYVFPLYHTKPNKNTVITIESSDDNVAKYDSETNTIVAVEGGSVQFTVTTTNKHFGPFRFNVWVGNGSTDNPYFIRNAKELKKIGISAEVESETWGLDKSYRLVNAINMSELNNEETGEAVNWTPIGRSISSPFEGQFNGQNLSISNLRIVEGEGTALSTNVAGLFGYVSSTAKIVNVTLDDATFEGSFVNAGGVAAVSSGKIGNSEVVNSSITCTTLGTAGGIVGTLERTSDWPRVEMCVTNATISTGGIAGGIAGVLNSGVVVNSRSNATITGYTTITGDSAVETLPSYAGGIVGKVNSKSLDGVDRGSVVKKCLGVISIAETILEDDNDTYGLVAGFVSDQQKDGVYLSRVESIYVKQVLGEGMTALPSFGEVGEDFLAVISNKVTGLTASNQYKQETYVANNTTPIILWNFEEVWEMIVDQTMPTVKLDGAGEALNEWEDIVSLSNAEDAKNILIQLSNDDDATGARGKTYILTNNIVVNLENVIWHPIGTELNPFKGVFASTKDHDYKLTITNLKIAKESLTDDEKKHVGLFGYTEGASISNIVLETIEYDANDYAIMGSVVAYAGKGTYLTNCSSTADKLFNGKTVGGVVGYVDETSVVNGCWAGIITTIIDGKLSLKPSSTVEITTSAINESKQVGGVAGRVKGTVSNSIIKLAKITVSGKMCEVGGIVGLLEADGSLNQCYYSDGTGISIGNNATGELYVGGIAGNASGTINSCYSKSCQINSPQSSNSFVGGIAGVTGNKQIKNSASIDSTLAGYYVGGLAAAINGMMVECYSTASLSGVEVGGFAWNVTATVSNCYNTCTLEGKTNESKAAGFSVKLPSPGKIERCYSNASFMGLGDKRAESFTNTRSYFADWFEEKGTPGQIYYSAFNTVDVSKGNEKADVVFDKIGAKTWGNAEYKVYKIDITGGLLSENEINSLVNTLGFDKTSIWNLESGRSLELKGCDFAAVKYGELELLPALPQYVVEEDVE